MDENYERLFQRIREKCRQQRWHGPDMDNPFKIVERMRKTSIPDKKGIFVASSGTFFWYDRDGKQYAINLETDLDSFPLQTDFEYPPATEEQLAATEIRLGYSLPPLLRALYTNVANGGFGPGYGLEGVSESVRSPHDEQTTTWRRWNRPVDLAIYLRKHDSEDVVEIPSYVWPESLFPLCHWGCGIYSHLDCASGRVFWGEAGRDAYFLCHQAASLYEWLDLWANGVNFWSRMYPGGEGDE